MMYPYIEKVRNGEWRCYTSKSVYTMHSMRSGAETMLLKVSPKSK